MRLNEEKHKFLWEHTIERRVLGLWGHWSEKPSLRIWFLRLDLKGEQETNEYRGCKGETEREHSMEREAVCKMLYGRKGLQHVKKSEKGLVFQSGIQDSENMTNIGLKRSKVFLFILPQIRNSQVNNCSRCCFRGFAISSLDLTVRGLSSFSSVLISTTTKD